MKSPMMLLMERLLQTQPEDTPKPRRRRNGRDGSSQRSKDAGRIERELMRAVKTYGRTKRPCDLARAKRLQQALLAVSDKVVK